MAELERQLQFFYTGMMTSESWAKLAIECGLLDNEQVKDYRTYRNGYLLVLEEMVRYWYG